MRSRPVLELLDITRIDAGGVEVQPQHFGSGHPAQAAPALQADRLRRGLALNLRGGRRVVYADPLLGRAHRAQPGEQRDPPTNDGGAGGRRRAAAGDRYRCGIRVWASAPNGRVFEEFYQVPNTPAVAPHQRKGLEPGAGDRQAPGRPDGRADHAALAMSRHEVIHARAASRRERPESRNVGAERGGPARAHASAGRRSWWWRRRAGGAQRPGGAAAGLGRAHSSFDSVAECGPGRPTAADRPEL